jgi:hypothetical protein
MIIIKDSGILDKISWIFQKRLDFFFLKLFFKTTATRNS